MNKVFRVRKEKETARHSSPTLCQVYIKWSRLVNALHKRALLLLLSIFLFLILPRVDDDNWKKICAPPVLYSLHEHNPHCLLVEVPAKATGRSSSGITSHRSSYLRFRHFRELCIYLFLKKEKTRSTWNQDRVHMETKAPLNKTNSMFKID